MKALGFTYATKSGISIGIDDMLIPSDKYKLVENAEKEVVKVQQQYLDGAITNGERYNKVIAIWGDVTEKVADEMFKALESQDREGNINPVYIMADSGARGSKQQIRQLSGMRGLDGQALRRSHRDPDHFQLPRRPYRAAVLHLHARRA